MRPLRFACCWVGVKYGNEYVTSLRDGILRYHPGSKIWCLTDRMSEVPDGVIPIDVSGYRLDGWWNKLLLFKHGVLPKGSYLYLDLDMIMMGKFDKPSGFHIMKDVIRSGGNSSAMSFTIPDDKVLNIWEHFNEDPSRFSRDFRGDQDFINFHCNMRSLPIKFFPMNWFPVWKLNREVTSHETVAMVYHGRPKPHQLPEPEQHAWKMGVEPIIINLDNVISVGIGRSATYEIEPIIRTPYWKGCAASHALAAKKALEHDTPVLILESDATTRKGALRRFPIPPDTDAVYCGLSRWGHSGKRSGWGPCNKELVRITNMLASHAILLVSRRYKEQYLKWATDPKEPFDIALAMNQPQYKVLALKNPPYYQGPDNNKNARSTNWVIR